MNYKGLLMLKLKEFFERHPDFTIGAVIYSACSLKFKGGDFTKGNLYEMEDEEFYGLLTKALVSEDQDKAEAQREEEEYKLKMMQDGKD